MKCINYKKSENVLPKSIYKDADGNVWLIVTRYVHEERDYVTALELPEKFETYALTEIDNGSD